MQSVICTLFEGHYHYGVAALANSLHHSGFRGSIFIGYKGVLTNWAASAKVNTALSWSGARSLEISKDFVVHFLPLTTDYHLTNYKPDFMLKLLNGPANAAKSIFYFDPDITVSAPWNFFEEWISYGVALCEDVNSPLPAYHPRRMAWREYFQMNNISLSFKDAVYVNGGFIGVNIQNRSFLETWKLIQETMAVRIGGLNRSIFKSAEKPIEGGPYAPFGKTDQDALNATVEAWDGCVSSIGREGMAFIPGAAVMHHALGKVKPWKWHFLSQMLSGRPPRALEKEYFKYADGPIVLYSKGYLLRKKLAISIASAVSRFYTKK